jgi:GntR family transcriptional repressor for pyruvate dehydrogenase complex
MVQQVVRVRFPIEGFKMARSAKAAAEAGGHSIVDEVTERIAFEIASGTHAPGDRLPSVRALALSHRINPSTAQIVMSRLRDAGFVDGAHRSGFVVRDIEFYGGIDTWRYLFRFAQRLPERATRLFENFLATRRVLVMEVVRTIARAPSTVDLRALRQAVDQMEALARSHATPEALARAELQASRLFMRQADQPVLLALYNTIGEILLTVPAVLRAMYAQPEFNVMMWRSLVARWEVGADLGVTEVELAQASLALAQFHVKCVERYKRLVREK